jgi:DNA ligase-1
VCSTVSSAISEVTAVSRKRLSEMYRQLGDLGDVAEACKSTQTLLLKPQPLTVAGVMASLRALATIQGQGSNARKLRAVAVLLRACREGETKYLVRTLIAALRVGANETTIVSALAKAIAIHKAQSPIPSKAELERVAAAGAAAFHTCPDLE